ncbi:MULTISPECIES: MFS transporter [unclassified Streptomyces]|uniref:MFS transporter n=1 Tax=unclassified Streptomyces TaxID=2593676 RepID=UPI0022513F4F|nr:MULTISPECIES: MFS transporter [unclassified Streptomyces]MCX5443404.1 MFS transporter [Streptomyces sp. NBC_00063]WSE12232.1 MFS transporter [Streptomyces sp. NBC_01397]WSE19397.1 MFS transporter [Streptomyces sp. NBC_01397]WUB98809.1 MFS transporter [Streptomyces sp. NBC_00569]
MSTTVTTADTPELARENAVFRKVIRHIVPFLILCYVVSYLDRVNVGFAKLQMSEDLGFSEAAYGLGAGLFFIGYFLFEVPSNLMLQKVGARTWIARIMISWGVVSALFVFVNNEATFYVLRFLLGAAEAGFYPGVILYCTYWFPSARRARVIAMFMSAIPVAGIFGNPLSGWIMDVFEGTGGWNGWQWLFLIEALPAIAVGVMTLFYLDNSVRDAKWLSDDEKSVIERAIAKDTKHHTEHGKTWDAFRDPKVWLMCLIYFFFVMGQYALTFWMPTFVESTGIKGGFAIGALSAVPYLAALVAMNLFGRSADKRRERRWHLVIPSLMGAVGFSLAASWTGSTALSLVALSIAAAGVLTCAPLFWSLPTAFLSGTAAAAGLAVINSVGNLAGFVSPYMIGSLKDATDSTAIPMYVLALGLVIGAAAVLVTKKSVVNR